MENTRLGVRWVPLKVPLERRLQTAAVIFYCSMFLFFPLFFILLSLALLFTPLFWLSLGYYSWIFYDTVIRKTQTRDGRRWDAYRRSRLWNYFRDYFPTALIKTADLNPEKNYIFGYHPHGVLSCGAISNFGTEANGFSQKYPGITPFLCTLKENFRLPIVRGFALWMGGCDASKESILYKARRPGGGNAVILVVGGAEESLEARPGAYKLKLGTRKGFVKLALRSGASLVPIFSFGENDLFRQAENPEGSTLRRFQETFKKYLGFAPPIFYGRGVFNYTFGMIPFRNPINTVVGGAIDVPLVENPDEAMVNKYHQLYMTKLSELFDAHKTDYGVDASKTLEFV